MGITFIITGICAAIAHAIFLDKFKRYKLHMLIQSCGALAFIALQFFTLDTGIFGLVIINMMGMGMSCLPI